MKNIILFLSGLLLLAASTAVAAELPQAGEFDISVCYSGNARVLKMDDAHVAWGYGDETGFTHAAQPDGIMDKMWTRCVGSGGVMEGKRENTGLCEYTDLDGDKLFLISKNAVQLDSKTRESSVRLLGGTGKYAGISGEGTNDNQQFFPEEQGGTYAGCSRFAGSFGFMQP